MNLTTFDYSLALISIILIITIIVIIYYKKTEDNDENESNTINSNKDTYLKVNMGRDKDMDRDMDLGINIEHFNPESELQSNINAIFTNNSNISALINSINSLSNNNPSLNIKPNKMNIDNTLQLNIADYIYRNTDDLIIRVDTNNVRINNKVNTLENQIIDLENIIERLRLKNVVKPNYSKIKSLNNGAELVLSQTPNTSYLDPGTGVNTPSYMVNLNNGCLSVGATEYDVYKCNDTNHKHLFKMEHIINETGYQKNIDKTVPFNNTDLSKVTYPFVLMRSVNNKNCLTNQNGNITVQPCDALTAQRWLPE